MEKSPKNYVQSHKKRSVVVYTWFTTTVASPLIYSSLCWMWGLSSKKGLGLYYLQKHERTLNVTKLGKADTCYVNLRKVGNCCGRYITLRNIIIVSATYQFWSFKKTKKKTLISHLTMPNWYHNTMPIWRKQNIRLLVERNRLGMIHKSNVTNIG